MSTVLTRGRSGVRKPCAVQLAPFLSSCSPPVDKGSPPVDKGSPQVDKGSPSITEVAVHPLSDTVTSWLAFVAAMVMLRSPVLSRFPLSPASSAR